MTKSKSLYRIKKGLIYLRHYGVRQFVIKLKERMRLQQIDYASWYEKHKISKETAKWQREHKFEYEPIISIVVPVYNTPVQYLEEMMQSVLEQTYERWELCIANANPMNQEVAAVLLDAVKKENRIKVIDVLENKGIAENTNEALTIASGEYVGFLDHDDLLAPNALFEVVKVLNEDRRSEVIYSDEDKVSADLKKHFQPHFKPEFNLDLLRSNNYICHFCVIRKSLIEEQGGLRGEFNGAQDYDLIFRCTENAEKIVRIPKILYHWRTHQDSVSDNPISKGYAYDAGKRAIEEHLKRSGEKAEVSLSKDLGFYHVKYETQGEPLISIIIPNKDHTKDLEKCLTSIEKSTYKNYEIIIIENNSNEKETFAYYEKIQTERIKVIRWEKEFNYSAINNFGVKYAKGEYLLFLNNDVEVIRPDWLQGLLSNCQRKQIGIAGAKLYYSDNKIQHAGVIIGIGGIAGHAFLKMPGEYTGYMHKASIQQNLSAVTAACMMVKRTVFEEVSGFTEELAVAFNDVDFCLKVREKGYLIVYNPHVELYHHESRTRGPEDTKEKIVRFQGEIAYMQKRWKIIFENGDPMYNPNLTLKKWDYSLCEK